MRASSSTQVVEDLIDSLLLFVSPGKSSRCPVLINTKAGWAQFHGWYYIYNLPCIIRIVFPPGERRYIFLWNIYIFYLLINVNVLCYTLPSNLVNHLLDIEGAKNKEY